MTVATDEAFRVLRGLIARREFVAARAAARALCESAPGFAPAWHALAFIALEEGAPAEGLACIRRALALAPGNAPFRLVEARCLAALGQAVAARDVALSIADAPRDAGFWAALGELLQQLEEHEAALAAYDRGLEVDPGSTRLLFNRATGRRFVGDLAGAEADYDRVIALRPDDCEAYLNRSELRRQTPAANHVAPIERLLARADLPWAGEVQLCYALAKEYEDLGRHAESFAVLKRGADLRRRHLAYDVGRDVATVDWIIESYAGRPAPGASPTPRDGSVFVLGLPRSGTTLVDRILSSHPALASAGELNAFAAALHATVPPPPGAGADRRAFVAATAGADFAALGADYLRRAAAAGHAGRFIDKMPLNYLYCGLIARALPGAVIVHVERHPMAVCYAMYKTLFRDGYPFSYALEDLAAYYLGYRRLMDFWHDSMPGRLHRVRYEALVADQRGVTAALLEAVGVPWDEACLRFHENRAATTTASAAQVRRPLYDSSVAQWRHYRAELGVLARLLAEGGVDPGEDAAATRAAVPGVGA